MDIRQAITLSPEKQQNIHIRSICRMQERSQHYGIVLLKKRGGTLRWLKRTGTFFGAGAVDTIVCGSGSGYVMAPYTIKRMQGLEKCIQITSKTG